MFFDEGNCRTVRLLREASHFLEACIEKLLVLEQEALSELRNESDSNKNEGDSSSTEQSYVNVRPGTSSAVSDINERTGICDTEHKSLTEPKKINPLDSDNAPPVTPETSSKRKHEVSKSSTVSKKIKCDKMIHQSDDEMQNNYIFDEKLSNIEDNDLEHNSESSSQNITKDIDSNELPDSRNVISDNKNIKNIPSIASQKEQSSTSKL